MIVAAVILVISVCLFGVAMATLWWMLHAWRTPEVFRSLGFGQGVAGRAESPLSFSLIVPARHEEAVLGATLDQLADLDYSAFEVVAVVGHDDPGTREVAEAAALPSGRTDPGRGRPFVAEEQAECAQHCARRLPG